jgi:hypothetical protein
MKTRKQYLAGECNHEEFYGQFVTPEVLEIVRGNIGQKRIANSKDPHLNDIPLAWWDGIAWEINGLCGDKLRECGDYPTLCSGVCIGKTAAMRLA